MNNKGFTTVEVLMCFVIVSLVMMSLFSTISAFNEKKNIEANRAKIYEYKNNITNIIQRDIIRNGLTYADIQEEGSSTGDSLGRTYIVNMTFKDGNSKELKIHERYTKTTYRINGSLTDDDEFYIEYGPVGDTIKYELPNLGETKGTYASSVYIPMDDKGNCYLDLDRTTLAECRTAKNLQINNILLSISNEDDLTIENHILSIYVGFYHPDLGTQYAINIVAPINYRQGSVDISNSFPTTSDQSDQTKIYYPDISTYKN